MTADIQEPTVLMMGDTEELERRGFNVKLMRFAFSQGLAAGRQILNLPKEFPEQEPDDIHAAATLFGMALGVGLVHATNPEMAAFVLERAGNAVREAQEQHERQHATAKH